MKKKLVWLFSGLIALSAMAISMASFTILWFTGGDNETEGENLSGLVGLRGYFFAGTGSRSDPYEIVYPIHLYNLSRLQNYGIFGKDTYFQIGHDFNKDDGIDNFQCLDTDSGERVDYLDMAPFFRDNPNIEIRPIGSESTPFRGIFNGHGIPVQNLKIAGYPEDIGVFGYASYESVIEGLVCENLEVKSLGYTKTTTDPLYKLFGDDIDDIFDEHSSELAYETNLDFYNWDGSSYVRANPNPLHPGLKNVNSGGVKYEHIDSNLVSDTNLYNGYFVITKPTIENDPFKYGWAASTSLITQSTALNLNVIPDDGQNPDNLIMIDLDLLANAGTDTGEFNNPLEDLQIDTRLSIIAYIEVDGIIYSRVIQSYIIEFYSNKSSFGEGKEYMKIFCTYTTPEEPMHESSNYFHGNNIGFLVGHLDGSLKNSYVYNGSLVFNSNDHNPIKSETQTGLVGEVGTNIVNALNPDFNIRSDGEIGVMNFTRIYEGIRSNYANQTEITNNTHSESGNSFYEYTSKINHDEYSLYDLYKDYLRSNADRDRYMTFTDPNSVDFIYNNIIQDEDMDTDNPKDRGLGVFKIVTPQNPGVTPAQYGDHVFDKKGECRIINGEKKTKVYFSTAEYDHTVADQPSWGINADEINPLRATTLPTYDDSLSFQYPFSRDYNYVFELDLGQNTASSTHNYMYNTNSEFLSNYLYGILRDKYGDHINHGNYRFGFMFRSSTNQALDGLSSYMEISKPATPLVNFSGDGVYYPSNSIVFNIDSDVPGANVSVVGNTKDISIYKFKTDGTSTNTVTEVYTMKSENTSGVDTHRFFTYDYRDGYGGDTSTTATRYAENNMGDGDALYAHIFYLPKLADNEAYCIGTAQSAEGGKAKLYYLAVQGQTSGTIDTGKMANIGNSLVNVDFLTQQPVKSDYDNNGAGYHDKVANANFRASFNTAFGSFNVGTTIVADESYLKYTYYNNPQFITYLMAYDFKTNPGYYVDNNNGATSPTKHTEPSELLIIVV